MYDNQADDIWTTFIVTAKEDDEDNEDCETYAGATGAVRYTEELETYVYLTFDGTLEDWRFATYDELYSTNSNGGYFPWDDNSPSNSLLMGLRDDANKIMLSFAALASLMIINI